MGRILLKNIEHKGVAKDILIVGNHIVKVSPAGTGMVEDSEPERQSFLVL